MRSPQAKAGAKTGPIAIIGMGCRFPGARNVRELWTLLTEGRDAVGTYPGNRFPQVDAFLAEAAQAAETAAMAAGGFLSDIDKFDAAAFELSPREAMYLDPQHRLLLECAWAALDDAGQPRQDSGTRNTGVFVGLWASDFENVLYGSGADLEFYAMTGSGSYGASGRLSFTFGFEGPSVSVDAACSSSLVAVHLACQSLLSGECAMALAGGANAILATDSTRMFTKAGMLARDGRCKFGSADADGFVRSEGAGVVVLKRLEDALAAGDSIHAVIRGGAVSNDGRTSGTLMTPSREGQKQTLHRAWAAAGLSGREIRYFEAHGTGTSVGDPVEVSAIAEALQDDGAGADAEDRSWIGSIKSNIGHTESAAGIAGLIKTVLALKHKVIPKSRLMGELNPGIDWEASPLRLLTEPLDLSGEAMPVIAGVSSFALTGTNAHVVLQEFRREHVAGTQEEAAFLVPVSARSEAALDELLQAYEMHSPDAGNLRDLAFTASLRRRHDGFRAAVVCESPAELREGAAGFLREERAIAIKDGRRRVVFIAPGQGSQWAGMARELYADEPVFRQMLERCDRAIRVETGWSLIEILLGAETAEGLKEIDVVQPALFSLSVSLAELWRSWGIVPDAVIGHSMGEVAAAFLAGSLTLEDAAAVICRRSRLMKTLRGAGAMLTIELPVNAVEALLRELGGEVSVGASNSPETTIVSGDAEAIARVETMLVAREVFCRRVKVDVASHSAQVDPILGELREALRAIKPKTCGLPLFSTVMGEYAAGSEMDAAYWVANLRQPVGYAKGIEALARDGYDVFVELSPHPVLIVATIATLKAAGSDAVAVASTRREKPERREMLASLGLLYRAGCDVAWENFYPVRGECVALPEYPFQRERCWPELEELKVGASGRRGIAGAKNARPLLGRRFESAMQPDAAVWEIAADLSALPYLRDHRVHGTVVLPAAAQVELVFEGLRAEKPNSGFAVTAMRFEAAMQIPGDAREFQLGLRRDGDGYGFEIFGCLKGRGEPWTRHSSGTAELRGAGADPGQVDLSLMTHARVHVAKTQHYRIRSRAGIEYGPAFQLVEEAWCGAGESLLRIRRVAEGDPCAANSMMHPALLDNCFQALQLAQPNGEGFLVDDTSLPVAIERIELYAPAPAKGDLFCHARVTNADANAGTLRGDMTLADQDGTVLGVVKGFEVQRISGAMDARAAELLWEIGWQPLELLAAKPEVSAARPKGRSGLTIILCDAGGVGEALAERIEAAGGRAVLVRQGTHFRISEASTGEREYEASPQRADDVLRVFADLVAHGERPVEVIHLWALGGVADGAEALLAGQAPGAYFVPWLIQAISACNWSTPPRLWMVTAGSMAVGNDGMRPELAGAAMWGVGAVAAVEHPELQASMVDLSAAPGGDEIDGLFRLISTGPDEDRVALRGNHVYVERFLPAETGQPAGQTQLFRKDATYLIAGGMGGVGATVAEWMAAHGAGCLVLISRRAESEETRAILSRIEALGARVVHARTDIADRAAVEGLMSTVRSEMPPIAGIMQAATVIDDATIMELSPSRFDAVMVPKVIGTLNLFDATAGDNLRFMMLFSSIASLYPQPGHGSYAAANAFMDSFARWARAFGRRVASINWGGWEQIGLARETGTGRSISGYEQQGFGTMSGQRALSALRRAIETDVVQAIASPIDLEQAAEFFGKGRVPPVMRRLLAEVTGTRKDDAETTVQRKLNESGSLAGTLDILEAYLIEELSRVLKLSSERIRRDTLFGSIGLDSLMTLEFVRRLKTALAVAIPTTAVFNHPTTALLAAEIGKRLDLHPETKAAAQEQAKADAAAAGAMTMALLAEEMSEDEALQALMQPVGSR